MSQCDAFGLLPTEAAAEVAVVIDVVNTWQEHFEQAGVTARDIASLAERIDDEELLRQRIGLYPAQLKSSPAKRKRPSPLRRI
jgi:serine/threonine-protein kinase HipA